MGLEKQGSKPTGLTGMIIGRMMNIFHTGLYRKYFKDRLPGDGAVILDIGCGGGEFLYWLANLNSTYRLWGVDHSEEMIRLARKVNKRFIREGRMEIIQGLAGDLKLKESEFDLITAFETVQFWPDTGKSFSDIRRMIKDGGCFIIINLYPSEGTKWWEIAKLKNEKEYIDRLNKAGFSRVSTDLSFRKGWIIVTATA